VLGMRDAGDVQHWALGVSLWSGYLACVTGALYPRAAVIRSSLVVLSVLGLLVVFDAFSAVLPISFDPGSKYYVQVL
jgi:hypothetical protein